MSPIILLYTCLPLWGLAFFMWAEKFQKHKKLWLAWASILLLFIPMLFFPLCAYNDKIVAECEGKDKVVAMQEFKLRVWICVCCYITELIIGFIFKNIGVAYYGELAVSCVNICQFILILSCWNLFKVIHRGEH